MPRATEMIGVTSAIKMADVRDMGGDAAQDMFIREAAKDLEQKLHRFVGGARPRGEFVFQVTGPHDDPIQGLIYVHTLAAPFDLDRLPTDCDAYRVHVTQGGQAGVQFTEQGPA